MPERRQEKRPPFNEKGGRTVGGGAGSSRVGGGSTPHPNRPSSLLENPKKPHPGPGESKRSNGLPLAGFGRGAQGLSGFGSWGTAARQRDQEPTECRR